MIFSFLIEYIKLVTHKLKILALEMAEEWAERIKGRQLKRRTLKGDLVGERIIWHHFTQQKMMTSYFICPNHCNVNLGGNN